MKAHFKYLCYMIQHKWFVLLEGLKLGVPLWLGLVHDWSKFSPGEWLACVRHFHGGPYPESIETPRRFPFYGRPMKANVEADFDWAFLRHLFRNKHHWQFWLSIEGEPEQIVEALSALGDAQWAFWTMYTLTRSSDLAGNIKRWKRQTYISRGKLAESVKEKNREWATKVLATKMRCLPMPDQYRREMLADWRSAGRAAGKPDTASWYLAHRDFIYLHPDTRAWVERELGIEFNEGATCIG